MQTLWNGVISFGLVAIPVGLAAATESRSISFRQVHRADGARVRHQRVCTAEDRPVSWEEIAKGYELPDGRMVVMSDDELAELPLPSAHTIEVAEFVPAGTVDPILFDHSYFLQPRQVALGAYSLLRDAMIDTGHVGLGRVAIRTRERLALLRPYGPGICLVTLLWPDEVREPDFGWLTDQTPQPREQEQRMAEQLVLSLASTTFDLTGYRDHSREALQALIDAKLAHREIAVPEPRTQEAADLEEALRASVDQARQTRTAEQRGTG
ncbi:non-homologous end joining protein Ku [Saccharopolyspora endophytica]|uniref:Non-homologous end joining protein Ku n=1 Tax=Saccharopolyspora endophytica TaxID=543886 RepID=A0ABS5DQH9_9PSEU|nr:Ku protein [Saccharopolyspora endophytica]MBQ0928565.1 Ku protein [Saccharopolyspora endophytica]